MKIFDLSSPIPDDFKNCVTAIGNFDAVHRGHQALLEITRELALREGRPFAVLTFEPHPRRLFRPDDAPFRITPYNLKMERLRKAKSDAVFVLNFDRGIAKLSADDFIQNILKEKLGLKTLVTGNDFHFGYNRAGSVETLKKAGFTSMAVDLFKDAGAAAYSASRIRGLLQAGHIVEANALLGWDWEINGVVQHGNKRGRELGYPTANIPLGETLHPSYGIYASFVQIEGETEWRLSATNIGIRPMFETPLALIETFIFDYSGDLYGKKLRVRPVAKIRDEAKFDSLEELKTQMHKDCATARQILSDG